MKTIILDTNVLIFDALFPEKLSLPARKILASHKDFSCADISLLEIAMLIAKKRIFIGCGAEEFINNVIAARKIKVLPISPGIATLSQSLGGGHKDPADLLIAATALYYETTLVTADGVLRAMPNLNCIW